MLSICIFMAVVSVECIIEFIFAPDTNTDSTFSSVNVQLATRSSPSHSQNKLIALIFNAKRDCGCGFDGAAHRLFGQCRMNCPSIGQRPTLNHSVELQKNANNYCNKRGARLMNAWGVHPTQLNNAKACQIYNRNNLCESPSNQNKKEKKSSVCWEVRRRTWNMCIA